VIRQHNSKSFGPSLRPCFSHV